MNRIKAMTDSPQRGAAAGASQGDSPRTQRLKAALKANIARRKDQARARASGQTGPEQAPATDDANHE